MSKELEALRNFISECENDWKTQPKRWVNGAINSNVSKYMDSLKSILTSPTAEEVCKALSEYLDKNVEYHNRFGFICNDRVIICLYPNNTLSFNDNYPAHIHNIVGRFYEGANRK